MDIAFKEIGKLHASLLIHSYTSTDHQRINSPLHQPCYRRILQRVYYWDLLNLEYIIDNSGDSIIESYSYSEGVLTIVLELFEIDNRIELTIKTDSLAFDKSLMKLVDERLAICRIEMVELSSILTIENNIYISAKPFGQFMNECKANYNLAYGKKSNELKYIFSLVGYGRLISCLLSDLKSIEIDELR